MKRISKKTVLTHLNKSTKEEIINEVLILFNRFDYVKEFYAAELSEAGNPILGKYKKKIVKAYSSVNPSERRTNMNVNKMILDFNKVIIYKHELIDLLLHRVECGVQAFCVNNKRSETYYNCIFNSFQQAVKIIENENCIGEFHARIIDLVNSSSVGKYKIKERMIELISNIKR